MTKPAQYTYAELVQQNPCEGCPAPCCRMQIHACMPPTSLINIDHIRYSLLFPKTELIISVNGEFTYARWETCSKFDKDKCTCTLHNTPQKPLTCTNYNPYNCWYKRNFTSDKPFDICRLDINLFEKWVAKVSFDKEGKVTSMPNYTETCELTQGQVPDPIYKLNSSLKKQ